MRHLKPHKLSTHQHLRLDEAMRTVESLAVTGYLLAVSITFRVDDVWKAASAEVHDGDLQWLGPVRVEFDENPGWDFSLSLSFSTPAPASVLVQVLMELADAEVFLPNMIVKAGWCRTPIRGHGIDVSVNFKEIA